MEMVIDFHSHILPGIDDGSADLEESIALLRKEAQQGITHVVATPHFYARYDTPEHFLKKRDRAEAELRREMEKHEGLPQISVGAEVYYFRGMSESEFLPQLTIRGKRCILIEMPQVPWSEDIYRELEDIWVKRGLTPVIAHIDRYIRPFHTHGIPKRLAQLPVLVQANGEFFLERSTASMALRMLRADQIQLLGSDCHNLTDRKPDLGEAVKLIEKRLGAETMERVNTYAREILCL